MPYFAEGTEAMIALEEMVDKVGVLNVLYALAHIARGKAEHLRVNWQDHSTAVDWDRDAARCERTATQVHSA